RPSDDRRPELTSLLPRGGAVDLRSSSATAVAGATRRNASSRISAISSQSTAASPDGSRKTPSQSENVPLADVGGLKNRVGSSATSAACIPGGAGHHS